MATQPNEVPAEALLRRTTREAQRCRKHDERGTRRCRWSWTRYRRLRNPTPTCSRNESALARACPRGVAPCVAALPPLRRPVVRCAVRGVERRVGGSVERGGERGGLVAGTPRGRRREE